MASFFGDASKIVDRLQIFEEVLFPSTLSTHPSILTLNEQEQHRESEEFMRFFSTDSSSSREQSFALNKSK